MFANQGVGMQAAPEIFIAGGDDGDVPDAIV